MYKIIMKAALLPLWTVHATFKYAGTDIYSQAGLDTSGWSDWTVTTGTVNGKTCNKVASPPSPKTPSEHMLGLYFEGWKDTATWIGVIPWDLITHLYYSFIAPSVNCHIPISEHTDASLKAIREAATAAGDTTRLILAVGGWADTRHLSWCTRNKGRRTKLIASILEVMTAYDFDGIDIDWEHPRSGGCLAAQIDDEQVDHCEGDKTDWMAFCAKPSGWSFHYTKDIAGYELFLAELRAVIGYNSHLSATIGIGEQMGTLWGAEVYDRFNWNTMCKFANFLQLMTYDYMGLWNNPKITSHQAAFGCDPSDPLQKLGSYPYTPSSWCSFWECGWESRFTDTSHASYCAFPRLHTAGNVEWFTMPWEPSQSPGDKMCNSGPYTVSSVWHWGTCPSHRIAIGVAAYGRGFCGVESGSETGEYRKFSEYCPAEGDTPIFVDYRNLNQYLTATGAKTFFNERTQTPFMYNPDKRYWLSYTDEKNVKAVTTYTLCRGLAGVFMWAATGDSDDHTMIKAAKSAIDAWDGSIGDYATCIAKAGGGPTAAAVSGTVPTTDMTETAPTSPPALEGDMLVAECCAAGTCSAPAIDSSSDLPELQASIPVYPVPTLPTIGQEPVAPTDVPGIIGETPWETGDDASQEGPEDGCISGIQGGGCQSSTSSVAPGGGGGGSSTTPGSGGSAGSTTPGNGGSDSSTAPGSESTMPGGTMPGGSEPASQGAALNMGFGLGVTLAALYTFFN